MKISIETDKSATDVMKRAGYSLLGQGTDTGEISFSKRAGGGNYPRFHAYVKKEDKIITINLHLDQKRPSYNGSHAHNAEYENPLIEQEALLIKKSIT